MRLNGASVSRQKVGHSDFLLALQLGMLYKLCRYAFALETVWNFETDLEGNKTLLLEGAACTQCLVKPKEATA